MFTLFFSALSHNKISTRAGSLGRPWTLQNFGKFLFVGFLALVSVSCTKKVDDKDNTLNIGLSANVKGLDPIYANDVYSATVTSQIFETLLNYHYLKRPLQVQPLVADGMPQVSADGLTHTLKIKPGAKFQDSEVFPGGKGREITAEDFIYSWRRLADPANQSDGFWIFDGKIKGLNEWAAEMRAGKATYETPIEGLSAPDKSTLVIKLNRPFFQLHYVLTMTYSAVVPKEAIAKYGKEFLNNPVGSGPYKFESWTRNSSISLVKNPNWKGEYPSDGEATDQASGLLADAGKALPFADKVIFHELIEDQPRWLNFRKGALDYSGIPKDNFDSSVKGQSVSDELAKQGIKLLIVTEPDVTYTAFNMADPVFKDNDNLRKAISHAIDNKTLIEKFYNGRAIDAHSPIPPAVDGYDPAFRNPYKEYDLAKAKEFLKKAGFPEGKGLKPIEYATTNSSTSRQIAELFKQNMEQIGVQVKIVTSSWPQFTEKIRDRKAQIFGIAWVADYPDAENFLQLLFGANASPGPNNSNFTDPEFDKLYKQAALLPPGPERTAIYHKMRDIVVNQAPWIPGVHRLGYYLNHGWLYNFKPSPVIQDFAKYLRVDPKKRAELKAKL